MSDIGLVKTWEKQCPFIGKKPCYALPEKDIFSGVKCNDCFKKWLRKQEARLEREIKEREDRAHNEGVAWASEHNVPR